MTQAALAGARPVSDLVSIAAAALIGLAVLYVAGHAQGATLHGAAHDTRHATGFPCH